MTSWVSTLQSFIKKRTHSPLVHFCLYILGCMSSVDLTMMNIPSRTLTESGVLLFLQSTPRMTPHALHWRDLPTHSDVWLSQLTTTQHIHSIYKRWKLPWTSDHEMRRSLSLFISVIRHLSLPFYLWKQQLHLESAKELKSMHWIINPLSAPL